ncbi:GIY-YIG nuclease family protein [Caproiciproducens sp. NJN-50]|uniref:GIY-YIG nuclease family protein n=1 Tax=Acutalibacteraceae TaxID=3082771 RepID=UPI000FFE13FE|nr:MULTISPECIES: GIY-YIG nuclease family protein [Acutalibacteraceae]QAT50424.1 GIY-YIG nuclease family protein [Caproiciproducens sp. NJN-50]
MKNAKKAGYYAYMLRCSDGTIYSGYTTDPYRRAAMHSRGKGAKYTRSRLPVTLVYQERFATKSEALRREAALKKLSHAEKIALIKRGYKMSDWLNHSTGG